MALVTVQRSPTNSNSSSTISDNECDNEERVKKQCESFFAVKGAALVLPHSNESRPIKKNPIVGELSDHIQSMFLLLRHNDRMTLAVKLESVYEDRVRYIILVSSNGVQDTEESVILGVDIMSNSATIGLVLPIWCETITQLDGDGGFNICNKNQSHTFKPVSVQALWSAMQAIHGAITTARTHNYFPGGLNFTWIGYYESHVNSSQSRIKEWQLMPDLEVTRPHAFTPTYSEDGHYHPTDRELTEQVIFVKIKDIMATSDLDQITSRDVRVKLEADLGKSLREYRHYLDEQLITYMRQMDSASLIFDHIYLGSEWNASHLEELERNNVGYILNVTMEIDNFYPNRFIYHNVRLYDVESSELLKYWDETYKFLSKAKEKGSKALVHCKMGISRSAATVIAYAMKEYNWPLEKARDFVSKKRRCVSPNDGFLQQLQVYEGMLDASRQRHNKLWRSKSESSLASSAECSQDTIEMTSSTEDIADSAPKMSGTLANAPKTNVPSPGLAPHTGHARRRSWSPKDSVAEMHFPSNAQSAHREKPAVNDMDFMMLDTDDCQDIQIIVPELLSPSSPTLTVPTESIVLGQSVEREPAALPKYVDVPESRVESLVLKQVSSQSAPAVGESPSDFEEGVPAMTSTPTEPEPAEEIQRSPPSEVLDPDSELNTNNNSATELGLAEQAEDVPPVEGTVKLRVTSIENHQLFPETEEVVEEGSEEPCTSTSDGVFSEPDIPVSSGTVLKQKQDIEDRIKAKASQKESPPTTRSTRMSSDSPPPTNDSTTSEPAIPVSTPPLVQADPPRPTKPETGLTASPGPPSLSLVQEPTSTASPTLQALEKGRIKKITEQLLSQKSPTQELEEADLSTGETRKSPNPDSLSPPPTSPVKFLVPEVKSSAVVSSLSLGATEATPSPLDTAEVKESQQTSETEEPAPESPSKEAFIKTPFGEEIPLEPGTVKRQTIDFEQLSSSAQHDEAEAKKETDAKGAASPDRPPETPDMSYEEDMIVIIRDSTTWAEEMEGQTKESKMDAEERAKTEETGTSGDGEGQDPDINSAYPEEGISSWKVGDVRKHTKQFEGLTSGAEGSDPSAKVVAGATVEGLSVKLTSEDEFGQRSAGAPGLSDGEDSTCSSDHVDDDVDTGSEAMEKKKLEEVEGIRERIEKLGLVNLRRTASIARISNERGSPVVLRRSDFSRPIAIRNNRARQEPGTTRSLESSPENPSALASADLSVDERRRSAHAKLVTPRSDAMPLQFYLDKPTSVEIRSLSDVAAKEKSRGTASKDSPKDNSPKKKQQHGKTHPLAKLSPAPGKHPSHGSS